MEGELVPRLSKALLLLKKQKVEPMLVGGTALNLWGGQVATLDLDLAIPLLLGEGAREAAIRALLGKEFRVVEPVELADKPAEEAIQHVRRGGQHLKILDGLLLDLVFHLEGVDLEAAYRRSHAYRLPSEVTMRVISFEDMLANKRALAKRYGSPKDVTHLQQLELLLESTGEKRPLTIEWTPRLRKVRGIVRLVRIRRVKGKEQVERIL